MKVNIDTCEHLDATVDMIEYAKPSWWADAHRYVNDDSECLPTLICPDCGYQEVLEPDEPDTEDRD